MKKHVSLLLVVMFCAFSVITVSAAPVEYSVDGSVNIDDGKEYVVNKSSDVSAFTCMNGSTLIIEKDVVMRVNSYFAVDEESTVIVNGTLDLSEADFSDNLGTVSIACSGTLIMGEGQTIDKDGWYVAPVQGGHDFIGGVCRLCNYECVHEGNYCDTCGEKLVMDTNPGVASVLSNGSLTIICSVACLAVGFLTAMFIFKKKKNEE